MYVSPIKSQRPSSRSPSQANGFTSDKRESEGRQLKKSVREMPQVMATTGEHVMYSNTIFAGSLVQTILGANPNRRFLLIQNVGAQTVFFGFGSTPNVNGDNAIEIPSGFQISFENGIVPNNEIQAVCQNSTKLAILEGSLK